MPFGITKKKNEPKPAAPPANADTNQKQLHTNEQVLRAVGAAGSTNTAAIYLMYSEEPLRIILQETVRFLLFPAGSVIGIAQAVLAWRQAKLSGMHKGDILKAVVEIASAAALALAVFGSIAASTIFGAFSSFIVLGILGLKAAVGLGSELYYLNKYLHAKTPEAKEKYKNIMKSTGIVLLGLSLGMVAVGCVLIGGIYALAAFGIASGIVGGSFAIYNIYKAATKSTNTTATTTPAIDTDFELNELIDTKVPTNNALMTKVLTQEAVAQMVVVVDMAKIPELKTDTNESYTFYNNDVVDTICSVDKANAPALLTPDILPQNTDQQIYITQMRSK